MTCASGTSKTSSDFAVPRNGFELVRNDADYGRHPEPRNRDVVRDRADDVDATSLEADLLPGFPQGSFNRAGVEILDFPPRKRNLARMVFHRFMASGENDRRVCRPEYDRNQNGGLAQQRG